MYAPQGLPAVFSSVLASSVIIVAARSGLLPPCVVPALGFCLHVPELFGIVDQAKQKLKTVTSEHLQAFFDLLSFGGFNADETEVKPISKGYMRQFSAVMQGQKSTAFRTKVKRP